MNVSCRFYIQSVLNAFVVKFSAAADPSNRKSFDKINETQRKVSLAFAAVVVSTGLGYSFSALLAMLMAVIKSETVVLILPVKVAYVLKFHL